MSDRFTIDLLPALEGDALWIEWGDGKDSGRMLIDGGRGSTTRLGKRLADVFDARPGQRQFDVVVCSHMDMDHIAGLIGLFEDPPDGFEARDIWFNGLRHIVEFDDGLGPDQSDAFEELVAEYVGANGSGWNQGLGGGKAIVLPPGDASPQAPLPSVTIAGMTLTLVSPSVTELRRVAGEWPALLRQQAAELASIDADDGQGAGAEASQPLDDGLGHDNDAGVDPEELARRPYESDDSRANGASIAVVAEFAGKRVLLAADAHAEVMGQALRRFQPTGTIAFDAVKLSHHGSEKNLSPDLLDLISCPTWLISSNGSRHHHPDRRAMARVVTRGVPTFLVFNYRSKMSREWGRASVAHRFDYRVHLPPETTPGVRYDVITDQAGPLPEMGAG